MWVQVNVCACANYTLSSNLKNPVIMIIIHLQNNEIHKVKIDNDIMRKPPAKKESMHAHVSGNAMDRAYTCSVFVIFFNICQ